MLIPVPNVFASLAAGYVVLSFGPHLAGRVVFFDCCVVIATAGGAGAGGAADVYIYIGVYFDSVKPSCHLARARQSQQEPYLQSLQIVSVTG